MSKPKILVTGGVGFIGSHTVVELYNAGYQAIIIDNLNNSEAFILDRIEQITGEKPIFFQGLELRSSFFLLRVWSSGLQTIFCLRVRSSGFQALFFKGPVAQVFEPIFV